MENDVAPSGSWTDLQSLVGCGHFGLVKFGLGLSKPSPCRPILESIQRASWNRKKKLRVSYSIPGSGQMTGLSVVVDWLSRERVRKSSPSRLSKYTDSLALTSCSHFWISLDFRLSIDFSIDFPWIFLHVPWKVAPWKSWRSRQPWLRWACERGDNPRISPGFRPQMAERYPKMGDWKMTGDTWLY